MFRNIAITADRIRVEESPAELVMDEDAFRAFYERTARGVWAYLARITGDRQLADDLLQEAFYRFLRANASHETEQHRRNSLYRIATNLARDARRRSQTAGCVTTPGDLESIPSVDETQAAERSCDLTRAMSRLNPKERAMLWLAYGEGVPHSEIATVLGVSSASLKTMLFRARRKLADLLRGLPGGGKR